MRAVGILFFDWEGTGWSEVYPLQVADYTTALAVLTTTKNLRLAMMAPDINLIGARISDTDVKGDSFPTGFLFPTTGTYVPGAGEKTFATDYALRCGLYGGPAKRSVRFVRGVSNLNIDGNGHYIPTAAWDATLDAWLNQLIASVSIATRIKGAVAPPYYAFTPILSASIQEMENRKVGRPFGLSRGRRLIA